MVVLFNLLCDEIIQFFSDLFVFIFIQCMLNKQLYLCGIFIARYDTEPRFVFVENTVAVLGIHKFYDVFMAVVFFYGFEKAFNNRVFAFQNLKKSTFTVH